MAASQKVLKTGKIGGFLTAKDNHDVVSMLEAITHFGGASPGARASAFSIMPGMASRWRARTSSFRSILMRGTKPRLRRAL